MIGDLSYLSNYDFIIIILTKDFIAKPYSLGNIIVFNQTMIVLEFHYYVPHDQTARPMNCIMVKYGT